MSDIVERMDGLVAGWGESDRRCLFALAYRTMTSNMLAAIESGEFDDDRWVDLLLDRFADYYFDAVDRYETVPDQCPPVWRLAFDAGSDDTLHPLRVLFLGINAHINYDLAFCVADVLGDWRELDKARRASRKNDYELVDAVIRRTVDSVQTDVVEPVAPEMGIIDRLMGGFDEWLFSTLIAEWRHDTWADALALLESTPDGVDEARIAIENRALRMADRVLHLGPD